MKTRTISVLLSFLIAFLCLAPAAYAEAADLESTEQAQQQEPLAETQEEAGEEATQESQEAEAAEAEEVTVTVSDELPEGVPEEAAEETVGAPHVAEEENVPDTATESVAVENNEPAEQPAEPVDNEEALSPTWTLEYPKSLSVQYKESVMTLAPAKAANIQNLGDSTIYLTITCSCVFSGNSDTMPITLCVGGVPITPGEAAVYGTVTSAGAEYAAVTLVFTEEGWAALASGRYSMTISYNSYIG